MVCLLHGSMFSQRRNGIHMKIHSTKTLSTFFLLVEFNMAGMQFQFVVKLWKSCNLHIESKEAKDPYVHSKMLGNILPHAYSSPWLLRLHRKWVYKTSQGLPAKMTNPPIWLFKNHSFCTVTRGVTDLHLITITSQFTNSCFIELFIQTFIIITNITQ